MAKKNLRLSLKSTFVKANKELLALDFNDDSYIDSSFSGTTATVGIFTPGKLTIGYVGDSRAILIKKG